MSNSNDTNNPQNASNIVLLSEIYPTELIILPIGNRPIFPGITYPLTFTGHRFVNAIDDAIENNQGFLGAILVRDENEQDYFESELYEVGTLLKVNRIIN